MKINLFSSLKSQTLAVFIAFSVIFNILVAIIYMQLMIDDENKKNIINTSQKIANIISITYATTEEEFQQIAEILQTPEFNFWQTNEKPIDLVVFGDDEDEQNSKYAQNIRNILEEQFNKELTANISFYLFKSDEKEVNKNENKIIKNIELTKFDNDNQNTNIIISMPIENSKWLNFNMEIYPNPPITFKNLLITILPTSLILTIISAIPVNRIIKPLAEFTKRAEILGKNLDSPLIPLKGIKEVDNLSNAFNQMQKQIKKLMKDKTFILAAISHDLRTPITILKLLSEKLEKNLISEKINKKIIELENMTEAALDFSKIDLTTEKPQIIELNSLPQAITDNKEDAGFKVKLNMGEEKIFHHCRLNSIKRAVNNLIDNAINYAQHIECNLINLDKQIIIEIKDKGPGINSEIIETVDQPFVKGNHTKGNGMGLSITKALIEMEGGKLQLINIQKSGLTAKIILNKNL